MNDYPIQTANNCCAYSYWVALRVSLQLADPHRQLNFTPKIVENIIGAPAMPDGEYRILLERNLPQFSFVETKVKILRNLPSVAATWDLGFSHAICLLPNSSLDSSGPGFAYDPSYGSTQRIVDHNKCVRNVTVECVSPESFPYAKWYWRFNFFRKLIPATVFVNRRITTE